MKKVVLFAALLLSVGSVFAQFQERNGVKSFIGASSHDTLFTNLQLTQTRNGVNGTFTLRSISMQVGLPYMGITNVPQDNSNATQYYRMDLGFPWGIRYRYSTFAEDAFSVSKGYYTDKVNVNWQIKANLNLISDFAIYRTMDISSSNPEWGTPIVTLASSARSFDDVNTQGGKLYRYKVVARGVENVQNIYSSFITGIGYRNPTGVITGNVSFNSGNPVKNVLISATPTGTTLNFGTSLRIPFNTVVGVNNLHKTLKDSLTLQAWVKPESNFDNDAITLFEIRSNLNNIKLFKVKLSQVNNRNTLSLILEEPSMGDDIVTLSDYIPSGEVDNKGDDVLVPITNVNGSFTHFSVVLRNNTMPQFYINGRLINASFAAKMNTILANNAQPGTTPPTVIFSTTNIGTRLNTSSTGFPQTFTQINLGGGKTALLDDIRVWETALTPSQILTDYRRYLKGNEAFLHTYITGNEGTGNFAYDLSSTGFDFHGNHADLSTSSASRISTSSTGLVQTGLVVNLEPGQTSSYPGSGSLWTNIGNGGSTYNVTLQNSPVYNAGYGGNFSFNGTNQSTTIARPVQDDFTLSAWIKTTSTSGSLTGAWTGMGIIDGEVPGVVNDYGLTMAQGKLMFGVGGGGGGAPDVTITSPSTYNDNKWYHVVCTRVKSTGAMVMYVNGVQVATGTGNSNTLTSPTELKIGRSNENRYFQGNISSINIYNNALTASQVQSNYNYFFQRHQEPVTSSFSNVIPTNTQLGILGVTDQYGNYVISSVPYTGNGNSYTIVPSLGVHKFNPNQQLAYVGVGSTVINNVNFKDISSFTFNGLAAYDSRGVFPTTTDAAIRGDIRDNEFYNAYTVGNQKYQKGEYWAFKNASGGIDSLRRYAMIPVPGATVNIDNQPVIDANNEPVVTDINGRFTIQVPIGQHAITLVKNGHNFLFDGRFPANTSSVVNGQTVITNTYRDFYQDQIEPITFIDTTKVTVIGRVVGGRVQAEQTIGFGENGRKAFNYTNAAGITDSTLYTSINNIGVARLTLGYIPVGSSTVTPEYRTSFQTNAQTGEFRVKLLPLSYTLSQNNLTFISGKNPGDVPLLDQDKIINFTSINSFQTPTFTQGSTTIKGAPYQEVLKYTYFATPSFTTVSQSSDAQILADGNTYTIASDQTTPVYSQFGNYQINIRGQETYRNFDNSLTNPAVSTVPVSGGQLIVTNNLALENTESTDISTTDSSIIVYSFKGGMPNTDAATGYKRTINLLYRLNGVDYAVANYRNEGILLGGVSDGTQSFVTAGPQIPDFVLRDPPGANSSASIKKGSSFTFSRESSFESKLSSELAITAHLGFELSVGGSVTGPVAKTERVNDFKAGIGFTQSSSNGKSIDNTYTFDQTISTSDDPAWVGSDADLYIGYSANQFYGTYNDLTSTRTPNSASAIKVVPPTGSTNNLVYPKVNTAMYFKESPQKTFFVYSQRSIMNDLIPKYQQIIRQIDSGNIQQSANGVLSRNNYVNSINLWKKIILNNETSKYNAFSDKELLKSSLNSTINELRDPVTQILSPRSKSLKDLLDGTFYQNISFDAGVGEITKSYEVERISSTKLSYNMELNSVLEASLGIKFNATGFNIETKSNAAISNSSSSNNSSKNTTNVSYSLKNNNSPGTLLSVDVINPFDGNGPIFITKGGQTSCPYEGAELSHYYKPNHPNVTNANATIVDLANQDRTPLSIATVALEMPEITVISSNVSGVFDGRNAEFVLKLRNTSTVNMDASFMLMVDQTTNPDNAKINIDPNGTIINIPAGQTVTFTMTLAKVKQDQFNYNNIKVLLKSLCDDNVKSSVLVSATFVPACSPVSVTAPSNNWLLNRNTAFDDSARTIPLNISIGGYNTSFSSFQKISLEYKLKGTPNWTGLRTYYKNPADTATARQGGDNNVQLIVGNQLNYSWDIAGRGLSNGIYEIRARTTCYNSTAFESPIIEGTVNLDAPVVFGTPTPSNGILGIGDDITVRFNKPIKTNGTVTKFEFKVQQNQLPVSHQVSLSFNGSSNTATINKPYITTGDLSIEFWMKNSSPSGTSTLLNQAGGLKVELINSVLKYTIGDQSISATILKDSNYNHYTLSYDASIPKLSIIENDKELTSTTTPNPITTLSFTNSNPIVIGGSTFKGNIHDLRLWSKPITRDQSVANMNVNLTGSESGILGFWPMNEGIGTIAKDLARFKSLDIVNANWDIRPKGTAYDFNGTNYLSTNSNTFSKVIISKEMDATVTFWMKTAQSNATILSNGKGDSTDFVEGNQFRNKWAFNTNTNGRLELAAEGRTYAFGNIAVNDDSWHHIAVSLTRFGGLQLYVDGNQMGSYSTANIGGLASTSLFIGARGQSNATTNTIDRSFVGQLDELSIWNMARTAEQIKGDMYFEQNYEATGLLFYSNFNKPEVANSNGPKYYYPQDAFKQVSDFFLPYTLTTTVVPAPTPAVPSILQTGLLVNLDPGQTTSYPGTGSAWTNIGSGGATYNAAPTNQSAPTYSATNGGIFTFNGTNQGTQVARGVIEDNFTLSVWFKTSSTGGNAGAWYSGMGLLDADMPGSGNDFGMGMAQGKLTFGYTENNMTSPNTYNDNNWHHVVVTRVKSTGSMLMYVDGVQVTAGSGNTNSLTQPSQIYIGNWMNGRFFQGSMSAVHMYNTALSATQVQDNYDALKGRFGISIVQTGLLVNLDPGQTTSYAGTGTVWTNIGSGGATYNATRPDGQSFPTFSSTDGGIFTLNGTNQGTAVARGVLGDDFALSAWFKTTSNAGSLGDWKSGRGLLDASWNSTTNDFGLTMGQGKLMFGTGSPNVTITSPLTYNDGNWHNVIAIRTKATGALRMYVDGILVASGTGNTNTLSQAGNIYIGNWVNQRLFEGSMSAIHIYNTALSATQVQSNYDGLKRRFGIGSTTALVPVAGGTISFTDVSPAIKPFRPTESIVVNPVINNDEIVLVPQIANWASIEGKVAYITVSNLNDMYDNRQASPVTWSAFINKNPIKMFVEGQGDIANLVKTTDSSLTFQITIVNQGGLPQPYTFNVPSWLTLSSTSGILEPNRTVTILATVDMNLAPGIYNNIIALKTNYGIDKKVPLNLRVLVKEPVLNFKPADYTQSMNIVGKLKVNGVFANDLYDKVYAVGPTANGLEVRGKASLTYDRQLNSYYVFLTVYSNVVSGETINFFIWDASQGNFLEAKLDTAVGVPFVADKVIGNFTTPSIFENTNIAGQLVTLNKGWTWVSFNMSDPRFASLNTLTAGANLSTSDLIQSNSLYDAYQFYSTGATNNGWSGSISTNGGITNNKMYKFKLANANELKLKGIPVDLNTWSIDLQAGWNWLPYVANKNIPIGDALANLKPTEGDLIKSQNLFSIYSSVARAWKGSLTYLNQSEGYMINVTNAQNFTYPSYINRVNSVQPYIQTIGKDEIKVNGGNNANMTLRFNNIGVDEIKANANNNASIVMNDITKATPLISADYTKFPNNMNAVVKLPEGFDQLYFYNDAGELRGNAKTMKVDGQDLAFITIYGDKPEKLTAHIGANNATQGTSKIFTFSSDAVMGTIANPILIELSKQEVSVFPNPFHDELKVTVNTKEKGQAKITIYSMVSSLTYYENTFNINVGVNTLRLRPNVPTGTYVIKVQIGDKVVLNKIIKD